MNTILKYFQRSKSHEFYSIQLFHKIYYCAILENRYKILNYPHSYDSSFKHLKF